MVTELRIIGLSFFTVGSKKHTRQLYLRAYTSLHSTRALYFDWLASTIDFGSAQVPGVNKMIVGASLFVIAGVAALIANQAGYVLVAGALVVGPIQFLTGLFQYIGYLLKSPESKRDAQLKSTVIAVLRCMAAMAMADGSLHPNEIKVIQSVHRRLTGGEIDEPTIRNLCASLNGHELALLDTLRDTRSIIDHGMQSLIVSAALMVLVANGKADKSQLVFLDQIANAVGIGQSTYDTLLSEVFEQDRTM